MCTRDHVSIGVHKVRNRVEENDTVELLESIAKSASLLYSVDVAILLRQNKLPKR